MEKEEALRQAIRMEMNMCSLYLFYRENFVEDKEFWKQLAKEEKEHAAILELAKDFIDKFPKEMAYKNIKELKEVNEKIESVIGDYKRRAPSKEEAYKYAYELEGTAQELHYQKLLKDEPVSEELKIFRKLNEADRDHAERIKKLLAEGR